MFRPRTQSTCSDLYSSSVVRRCLPTRLPRALSPKGRSTLAPVPPSPFVAILDAASSLSPVFATLTKNTRGGVYSSFSTNSLQSAYPDPVGALKFTRDALPPSLISLPFSKRCLSVFSSPNLSPFNFKLSTFNCPSAIPFKIRTYEKRTRNSCRIRTSKTQNLRLFRMNTYEKTGGGVPPAPDAGLAARRDHLRARSSAGPALFVQARIAGMTRPSR